MPLVTRRRFLKVSAGTLAAAAAPMGAWWPEARADAPPGARMRFGLVTYQWGRDWDLPTLIANCEKAKALGVELRTTHKHGVEPSLNRHQRREVRQRLAASPVVLVGLGSNEAFDHPDVDRLKRAIAAAKAFLQLSHDVGGSGVKVKPNRLHKNVPRERTIEQIGRSLNELARFGANLGQQIRLEVHGRQTSELPVIKAIMDVADHPGVGVCWNSNGVDLRGAGLEHNFSLVKDRFGATAHVRELSDTRYPYQRLMNLFVAMDYAGWVLLEASTKPRDRVEALGTQRALWEKMVATARKAERSRRR